MKQCVLLILLGCVRLCFAQFTETFDTPSALWQGTDSVFAVNVSKQLQLNAAATGEGYLSTASEMVAGEWTFWCRFQFSPSTSNFMRMYLVSDTPQLNSDVHGYYVQLGGITGSYDSIVLCRQDGAVHTRLIGGRRATVAKTDNSVRIKVLRDEQGIWQLFSDTTGKYQYALEGTVLDAQYMQSGYLGLYAKYTSSNTKRMYWDDIYAGEERFDKEGPILESVHVLTPSQLKIVFDEPVDESTALNVNSYELNNGMGWCAAAEWGENTQTVLLDLNGQLTNQVYSLKIRNMNDLFGNTTTELQGLFTYYYPQQNDIIISEWMADPSPSVGLPEHEYLELYNRSMMDIPLLGWKLSDGTSTVVLPNDTLKAQSFAIICAVTNTLIFSSFGQTIEVPTLPSLNNSGDQLTLFYVDGIPVHSTRYDLSWYKETTKSEGGYAIELNSPNQLCKGKYNAGASEDESGGTPGRANSHWTLETDTISPDKSWYVLVNPSHVRLVWNEPMDTLALLQVKIMLNQQTVSATQIFKQDTFDIFLADALAKDSVYILTLEGAKDCSGNRFRQPLNLYYVIPDVPQLFDVLINEIMSDPDPVVGLPAAEYVELYNRSNRLISLDGWIFNDGTSSAILPNILLYPDSLVVITSNTKQSLFVGLNNTVGVPNFPSLGNTADTLFLRLPDGQMIHWIAYQSSWHKDVLKRYGGWSLEMVDVKNPCGQSVNWLSSVSSKGGTPGKRNSVVGSSIDKQVPQLTRVFPISDTRLKLYFTESIDSVSVTTQRFSVFDIPSQSIQFSNDGFRSVNLELASALKRSTVYTIIVDSVCDCAGNRLLRQAVEFGLPEPVDSGDVTINELLFNPSTGGSDFVELYNRSERIVDVSTLYLANRNADGQLDNPEPISTEGYLLFPHQYIVCSPDINSVKQYYTVSNPSGLVQTKLPSMNDDAGYCILTNTAKILDELVYDEKMHLSMLDNKEGVSLERIDFNRPTSDRSNWTSASSTSGYATPTVRNSQYATTTPSTFIKAEPQVFSPDGDGYNDLVHLSYSCEGGGNIGSFRVYNAAGQLVKHLLSNAILGTEGVFTWDGMMDNGERAPMGIYIGYFEVFTTGGKVSSEKIVVVVAARL